MQFLLDFINTAEQSQIDQYLATNNCQVLETYSAFDKTFLVSCSATPPADSILEAVVQNDAAPIQVLTSQLEFSTDDNNQWWKLATFTKLDLSKPTQSLPRKGSSATVYVVDSGVKSDHPDLVTADIQTIYSFNGDHADHNGHGTAIASVISGETCGVTNAKIRSVKIFQNGVPTLQSHLLAAFDAIVSDVTATPNTLPVVNLSWSIPRNSFIDTKIRALQSTGLVVITAAGNSGVPIENVTPAAMPEVLTVGAYNQDFRPCDFSNYTGVISTSLGETNSGELDVWAPGEQIRVASLDGSYGLASGTSLAAAVVSAAAAYTSELLALADGSAAHSILDNTHWIPRGGDGLLILDSKYQNSVNKIISISAMLEGQNGIHYGVVNRYIKFARSGSRIELALPHELLTSAISIADPLPPGVQLDKRWLVGTIDTTVPFYWTSTVMYTTYAGDTVTSIIEVGVLPVDFDIATLPTDDPIVTITSLNCGPLGNGCGGACTGSSCVNCGANIKGSQDCQCLPSAGSCP